MQKTYKILLLVIIPKIMAESLDYNIYNLNYCGIKTCKNPFAHTLCRYEINKIGERCFVVSSFLVNSKLKTYEKLRIVNIHNALRQYVAAGNETRGIHGPQPPAAFMPNLIWDEELAVIAQTWANQCPDGENPNDECRDVTRYRVGQSWAAAIETTDRDEMRNFTVDDFVQSWYNHVTLFDNRLVDNYVFDERLKTDNYIDILPILQESDVFVKEYAQIVWANTTTIGCGRMRYVSRDDPPRYNQIFVCNYGSAGNNENEKVYQSKWREDQI